MTARYKGAIVKVVRVEAHRAYIVWRGMVRRVNKAEIELLIDTALIATLVLALLVLAFLVLR